MNKPVSIIIEEARQSLGKTIREMNLSPTILEFIIKEAYDEIKLYHQQELNEDKQKYEEYLMSQKNNENVEEVSE